MKIIDAGHEYDLDSYDGGEPVRLVFVKREGEGYPFNVGHHPGTNCQEVWRASILRIQYLQRQEPCEENVTAIRKLRELIWLFEVRAARRHGRTLPNLTQEIETLPTCAGCGHVGCTGEGHHEHVNITPPTSDSARRAAEEIRNYVDSLICAPPMREFERAEIERIISKHFATAPAENDAERLRWLLKHIVTELPQNRDWLDPDVEREARELTTTTKGDR